MIMSFENSGGGAGAKPEPASVQPSQAVTPPDTSNQFAVCAHPDGMLVIRKLPIARLSKDEAINLAAWLVCLADPEMKEFRRVCLEIAK